MNKKFWIRLTIFVLLTAAILLFANEFLCVANEKDEVGIYGFFLEPEDSVDVVLIGASFVYSGFYSPLAYEQQGFTSYALSTSSLPGSLYRYAAELAIEKQHPQLLVFETGSFGYEDQQDEISLAKFLDAMPDSKLKQRIIDEVVPEELQDGFRFPFIRYHSALGRFSDLSKVMQDKIQMRLQGYSLTKNFATTPFRQQFIRKTKDYDISEEGLEYLRILLDYLQEAEIENVLFIRCPSMVEYAATDSYKQMIDMIREAGFDFVNLSAAVEDMGIDPGQDFYNTTHFNVYGAEKFTTFFSDYIMKRYQLDTEHDPAITEKWESCASYNEQIVEYLKTLTDQDVNGFLYTQKDFLGS